MLLLLHTTSGALLSARAGSFVAPPMAPARSCAVASLEPEKAIEQIDINVDAAATEIAQALAAQEQEAIAKVLQRQVREDRWKPRLEEARRARAEAEAQQAALAMEEVKADAGLVGVALRDLSVSVGLAAVNTVASVGLEAGKGAVGALPTLLRQAVAPPREKEAKPRLSAVERRTMKLRTVRDGDIKRKAARIAQLPPQEQVAAVRELHKGTPTALREVVALKLHEAGLRLETSVRKVPRRAVRAARKSMRRAQYDAQYKLEVAQRRKRRLGRELDEGHQALMSKLPFVAPPPPPPKKFLGLFELGKKEPPPQPKRFGIF